MPRIHDHENEINYFARTNHRGHSRKFGIKTDDRRRHMYIIGKTGMGKTTLIENMVLQDIYNGHGVAYIDPHGDTVEKIIDYIPSWRINDVVYLNPADLDYPIGFNVLEAVTQTQKHLLSANLMGVFKKIWEGMWSARMEYILSNTILALMDTPGTTLVAVNRMYSDADFRKMVVTNIKDPIVKQFWVMEYAGYSEKFATEAVAAIQNKIGQFITSGLIRNIIGQVKSTINIRELMDEQKIFLVNLSKGRIGEDNMRLLGGMLITKIQLAAMDRVDIPEALRKDYYLYVDEFQNFATESFAAILSEARKFRLNLIVAHQYIAQLTEEVRDAVLGNVGTLVLFRVGAPDGLTLEPEMAPRFLVEDIINLPKFQIYIKLMIDGVASAPFSAATLPPIARLTESQEKVIRVSRERYSRNRDEIEEKIAKWAGIAEDADIDALMEQAKAKSTGNPPKKKYNYKCSWCAKDMKIPVKLDRTRPIYCEDCRDKVSDLKRTREYDARKDLIYDEELNVVGSVAELGSDGAWVGKVEEKEEVVALSEKTDMEREAPKERVVGQTTSDENREAVAEAKDVLVVKPVSKPPEGKRDVIIKKPEPNVEKPTEAKTVIPLHTLKSPPNARPSLQESDQKRKRRRKRGGSQPAGGGGRDGKGGKQGIQDRPRQERLQKQHVTNARTSARRPERPRDHRSAPIGAVPDVGSTIGKPLKPGAHVSFDDAT
ncbi:hypothetical protein A3B32_01040 [Candidatus Uhrbacteria bacterium RIFCSPLOWO2_01_FULL_53_9]|nr:MAG: hypothetical protein A3B32_01040 [Candidatus Uhrbacteria bacterium RIFCSPLOWO2_01_FULL_53_9]